MEAAALVGPPSFILEFFFFKPVFEALKFWKEKKIRIFF